MSHARSAAVAVVLALLGCTVPGADGPPPEAPDAVQVPAPRHADRPAYESPADARVGTLHHVDDHGTAWYDVWVPVVGSGARGDDWRPDLPRGVRFSSYCGVIGASSGEEDEWPRHPESGKRRPTVLTYWCVTVPEADLPRVATALPLHRVSDHDKLLVRMVRLLERDGAGKVTRQSVAAIERVFVEEQGRAETDEGHDMMMLLAMRMYRRGLPVAAYLRIAGVLAAVHDAARPRPPPNWQPAV